MEEICTRFSGMSIMDKFFYKECINGYIYYCGDINDISYYYDTNRNKWLPFRDNTDENNTKTFFIDDFILSLEQICNLEYYNSIINLLTITEEWKTHESFHGYSFSSFGRLKLKNGELSDCRSNNNGYIVVNICNSNGERKKYRLHRIIAELFIHNNDISKDEVDHINGIRHDNRISNLRWVTASENMNNIVFKNTTSSYNRPIYQFDENKKFIKEWKGIFEIVAFYGVQGIEKSVDIERLYKGYYWERKPEEKIEGETFKELFLEEINGNVNISDKGRFLRDNGSISSGTMNREGYIVITKGGKQFRIHRLILMAFKPIINYKDMVVDHIDGDKSNNNIDNLEWVTTAENTRRHYVNNNHNIKHKTREIIFTHIESGKEFEFQSITFAAENSGFTRAQIRRCLETKKESVSDYRGSFKIRYKYEVQKIVKNTSISDVPVNQYDMNRNFIKTHQSLIKAANSIGVDNSTGISECCRGNQKFSHGYIWRYATDKISKTQGACVVQLDANLKYLAEFKSAEDAERATNTVSSNILKTCKGINKTAGGFKWMYKEDYQKMIDSTMVGGEV